MSSQAGSSKEVVAPNPQPPPKPPEELPKELQGGKLIFFTLDTLFNRDYAIECALKRCMDLNKDLESKSMDELKIAYRGAMDAAYRQHIQTQLRGPQAPMDKVGLIFQQLKLELPSLSDRKLLSNAFAAEFNRNRSEATGASHLLKLLKRLGYSIVVVDHGFDWQVVKDLNFWHDVGAMIRTWDLLVRKPDRRVFQKALNECQVSARTALIVGFSVEEDIFGILAAGAEPILYMPGHNYMTMDVRGTRVPVVRTMAELSSEIHLRPENSQLVPAQHSQAQHNQVPPRPQHPVHPPMVYEPQSRENPSDQNAAPSAARQRLPPVRLHPLTQDYGISSSNPAQRSSPRPSTQSYGPRAPTPATEVPTPSGQVSRRVRPDSNSPVHSSGGSTPRVWLHPPTEDYGISIRNSNHNEDRYQPRSRHDGYGHGTSRDRYTDQGGYPPPPLPPPRPPSPPPTPRSHTSYQDLAGPWPGGHGYETSRGGYTTQGGYPPEPSAQHEIVDPELRDVAQSILDLARDIRRTGSSSEDVDT
ncbi:uncharacterized protein FMAN_10818 [Fusarium mangiferae]|uniref:Uncharacterized protein n=1 Tax=Fusarium mangiferae TaxID=192010 RepID=A0A1L7UCS2_FUSMA|nr:uncharacterized protein FMAN_10818 [Fusarium mangiferae]CVL05321.1 uncharacterized protein FMAN_10818 [Fusarium mangiferae]